MSHLNNQDKFEKQLREQFDSFEAKPNEALWDNIAQNLPADNFEKTIAAKLNSLKVEPSEGIWLAIEKHLPQITKYSKKLVYLWTFAVLTIGVIAGIFINKFTNELTQNKDLTHPLAFVWLDSLTNNNQLAMSNEPIMASISSKQTIDNNNNIANNLAPIQNLKNTNDALVSTPIQELENYSSNGKSTTANHNSPKQANTQNTDNQLVNTETTSQVLNNAENGSNANTENNVPIAKNNVVENNAVMEANKPKPVKLLEIEESKIDIPTKVDSAANLPKVKTTNTNQASENDYTGASLKREKLTIIAYAGMGYSFMRYTEGADKTNSAASLNLREKTESTESEISGGFLIGYDISKRITISSGIIMANFKQTMSFDRDTAQTPMGNYEENMIYYNDTIKAGNSNVKSLKYSYTEIPVFITYKIFESPKFELAAQTGLGIGFLTGINTYVIAQNNIGVYEVNNKNDFPAFKNTLFFTFQPQFTYNLSFPGTAIGFMPIIKASLTNIVSDDKWLKQYPYNMSFNLFLRKRF